MRLMLSSMDALMHRNILVAQSGFFTAKLSDRWSNQRWTLSHINQISDWDNVEVIVLSTVHDSCACPVKDMISAVLSVCFHFVEFVCHVEPFHMRLDVLCYVTDHCVGPFYYYTMSWSKQ
ncbi:hypothetical protein VPH35_036837 [Triticum aestivum]